MLGKRDSADSRNYLWQEYAATIVQAQPKYFVAVSMEDGSTMGGGTSTGGRPARRSAS